MASLSKESHSVKMLVFDGSGRLSDLWRTTWPERANSHFDPVLADARLHQHCCFAPRPEHVDMMRGVLSCGELLLLPVFKSSGSTERLCLQILTGDKLLSLAMLQRDSYEAARRKYRWPRLFLTNTSILLALASTVVALLAENEGGCENENEGDAAPSGLMYYFSIFLPAVMLVVDQVESYLGTGLAVNAVERGAGLVESQMYRYKLGAADFADAVMMAHSKTGGDIGTDKQLLLTDRLHTIDLNVASSGAIFSLAKTGAKPKAAAAAASWSANADAVDMLDGDQYLKFRINPQLEHHTRQATACMMYSLIGRVALFVASAAGTVIATLGYSGWITVTVSFATGVSRWLATTRVEEKRNAASTRRSNVIAVQSFSSKGQVRRGARTRSASAPRGSSPSRSPRSRRGCRCRLASFSPPACRRPASSQRRPPARRAAHLAA